MKYYNLVYPVDPLKVNHTQGFGKAKTATLQKFYESIGLEGHNGDDWGIYNKPIRAMHDGIAEVYATGTGGNSIRLWDKDDQLIMTFYCHLKDWLVNNGEVVSAGQKIGIAGNSGTGSFGGHLHDGLYELSKDGKIKNYDNGYHGAINAAPHLAVKFKEDDLFKHPMEPKVYILKNQYKFWINSEEAFFSYTGFPVSKAKVHVVDNITLNFYKYGGQIGKKIV